MRMLFSGLVVAAAVALSAPAVAASVMSPAGVAAAAIEGGFVEQVAAWLRSRLVARTGWRWPLPADGRACVGRSWWCRLWSSFRVAPGATAPYTSNNFRC